MSNYLHLEISERNPIKLKENKLITKELNVFINNNRVLITDDASIKDLITLKFSLVNCKKNEIKFSIYFKIENALIEGEAKKLNENNWMINLTKEVEH